MLTKKSLKNIKKEQLPFLQNQINNDFFRGTKEDKQKIIDHINQTDIFNPYHITWQRPYYNSTYFINPDMLEDTHLCHEIYHEEVEKNKLKNNL